MYIPYYLGTQLNYQLKAKNFQRFLLWKAKSDRFFYSGNPNKALFAFEYRTKSTDTIGEHNVAKHQIDNKKNKNKHKHMVLKHIKTN